ncbi:MAG: penicillin-binding protein 2, partial [Actinomycetota bacterium]|nr:penicillin-binding protein 2 [Actinomycetota bacterium]
AQPRDARRRGGQRRRAAGLLPRHRRAVTLPQRRIGLLFAAFLVLLAIGVLRTLWLGVVRADDLEAAALSQQVDELEVPAPRGAIVDRNGTELAVSAPAVDVIANPHQVKNAVVLAGQLAPLLGRPEPEVLEDLTREDTGFVYLARRLQAQRARDIGALGALGLTITDTNRRVYPRDTLASQLLGAVGTDGEGLFGLEMAREEGLGGDDGRRRVVRDALGDTISVREEEVAEPGETVRLTIDAAIQGQVEDVLARVGERYSPKGATALVMRPQTGELLALANWPRVDANQWQRAPDFARRNRAVSSVYEPGSTFKAFTVAGALEAGAVEPGTMFDLPPSIQVADRVINESHPRGAVTLSVTEILAQSSNVGTIKIGQELGASRFDRWVRRFGFGAPTAVDLPGEEAGLVLGLDRYSGSSMGNLPIGQGVAVTPMQLAAGYAAIANGGVLRPPRVVAAIGGEDVPTPRGERVISPQTAAQVRTMLKGVLAPGGTAPEAAIAGYPLAGKTGTANKIDEETGEYSESRYIASFAGFAPADEPELLITVMVDEPQGGFYGAEVAAPAFQEIAAFTLPYLKIPPR